MGKYGPENELEAALKAAAPPVDESDVLDNESVEEAIEEIIEEMEEAEAEAEAEGDGDGDFASVRATDDDQLD